MAGASLLLVGLVLLGMGASATVNLLHADRDVASPAASAAPAPEEGGLRVRLAVGLEALGQALSREVETAPAPLDAVPLPTLHVGREVRTPAVDAPVGAHASFDVASGASARPATATEAQSAVVRDARVGLDPAQAVALGAAAFTAAGLVAYFWTSLKAWAGRLVFLPLLPLYARVTRAQVFDNDVRGRIFGVIKASPGVSASDLAKRVGVSWGTTMYHLEVLEQNRMVTSLRNGRHRRYFENGAQLPHGKEAVAVLQNPVTATIAATVRQAPGATQKELASATGMTPQALHWHLARLVQAGLVRKQREGRVVRHFCDG